ncbi:MAG TPA: HAD family hydrolase [Kofleriaceae bacterium]|nr:HAD family hydrolase [Kofleriaceae bacterium]
MTNRSTWILSALLAAATSACAADGLEEVEDLTDELNAAGTCGVRSLRTDLTWYGDNREVLQGWIDELGCGSPGFDPHDRPIALFDWDNTVIKNDIGDAITFYLIENGKVRQPPGADWGETSPFITPAAQSALSAACGTSVPPGHRLPTHRDLDCADEMLSIYIDGVTRSGAPAFAGWNYRRMEPTYAWTAQLMAGYTPHQIRTFTAEAIAAYTSAPIGATKVVGTRTVNAYIRVYDQIADLIATMKDRGFAVWIVSASPQPVVETFGAMVGVGRARVIGIRHLRDAEGRYTYHFQGCGTVADGEDTMISYIEGKRCWVNKVVFGDDSPGAMDRRPPGSRQVFAAGDSDTDIEFMRDATYKLALNRNKRELMCFAYDNLDGAWLVNPMFVAPRPQQTSLYPCSTTACKDEFGTGRPCVNDAGQVIPDQADTVF